jgi:hypothetical protein
MVRRAGSALWERTTGGTALAPNKSDDKYQSVTLRVITPVMEVARVGAVEEGISLNNLANRQLRQYAEWDRVERKLGYVTVRDRVLRSILDRLSEDEVMRSAAPSARSRSESTSPSTGGR